MYIKAFYEHRKKASNKMYRENYECWVETSLFGENIPCFCQPSDLPVQCGTAGGVTMEGGAPAPGGATGQERTPPVSGPGDAPALTPLLMVERSAVERRRSRRSAS